jgi:hypothetical protein
MADRKKDRQCNGRQKKEQTMILQRRVRIRQVSMAFSCMSSLAHYCIYNVCCFSHNMYVLFLSHLNNNTQVNSCQSSSPPAYRRMPWIPDEFLLAFVLLRVKTGHTEECHGYLTNSYSPLYLL